MNTPITPPDLQSLYGQDDDSLDNCDDTRSGRSSSRKYCFQCGEVCYTYVHPNSYRQAYRFLQEWQREWGNYERRHQSDEYGLPLDPDEPPIASLQSLMESGWDVADLRDPLEGIELSRFAMRFTLAKEGRLEGLLAEPLSEDQESGQPLEYNYHSIKERDSRKGEN